MRAHQYLQQPNQVACTIVPRAWTCSTDDANIFGLEPHFGCCTANLHQGWTKFAASLLMSASGGGLVALAYARCRVRSRGRSIEVATDYPFSDEVTVRLRLGVRVRFPLRLRIPAWCEEPQLRVSGEAVAVDAGTLDAGALDARTSGFVRLDSERQDGDVVELNLPSRPRVVHPSPTLGALKLGPFLLALPAGEDWCRLPARPGFGDWEVRPTTPWNYGLVIDPASGLDRYRVARGALSSPPFGPPPLRVDVGARRVYNPRRLSRNSAGRIPSEPELRRGPPERLGLVLMELLACAVAEFPCLRLASGEATGA